MPLPPTPVSPPSAPVFAPMDPRIRRRRIEVRRHEGRRRLRLLLVAVAIAGLSLLGWLVVQSPLLDVDHVVVQGAVHTKAADVVAAAAIRRASPMVKVDQTGAARRVDTLPWVASAVVQRHWPGTVTIRVIERMAAAVTSTNAGVGVGQYAVVDAGARVLEWVSNPPGGLPVLEGLGPAAQPGHEEPAAKGPLAVVAALSPALSAKTAAVVAVQGGQVELRLNPRGTVRLGPPDNLEAKVKSAESVLAQVDTRNLLTLDVRLASSPVLTRG